MDMGNVCSKCGAALNEGAKFCTVCGEKVPVFQKSFCVNCGAELNLGAKFCVNCGARAAEVPVVALQPEQPKACPNCGKPIRNDSRFCLNCGTPVDTAAIMEVSQNMPQQNMAPVQHMQPPVYPEPVQEQVCPKCGAPLNGDSKFCIKCGANLAMNVVNMAKKMFQRQSAASPYPGETLCSMGQAGDVQLSTLINAARH